MEFISIQEAIKKGSSKVALRGWVYRERGSNALKFVVLRDSSNILQCVFEKEKFSDEEWKSIDKISIESSLKIWGELKKDERAPTGYELHVDKFKIQQLAEKFPITKDQSAEFLFDVRHLAIRSRKLTAVMKIRSAVFGAIQEFFRSRSYYEMAPPIFTPNACEGGSTLFEVKYYKEKVYLTQSWQLYAEAAIFALEKIFCISPCFRSEKSKTTRHLSEFWMAEVETAWMEFPELQKQAEELISFIVKKVLESNKEDLKILERDISKS